MDHARIVNYRIKPETIEDILQLANQDLAPIYRAQPGFLSYYIIQTGEGEILSVSIWASSHQAEDANRAVAGWVQEHLSYAVLSVERKMGAVIASATSNV